MHRIKKACASFDTSHAGLKFQVDSTVIFFSFIFFTGNLFHFAAT